MASLPLGNDNDLDDSQFYNRIQEIKFISDNLELTEKGSTPTILLTGIRGVGKTALMKKLKKNFKGEYLVVYMDLTSMDKFKKEKLDRLCFMKLFYESIITACDETNILTIDKCTNGIPYYINSFARLLPPNEELNEEKIIYEFKKSLEYLSVNLSNAWYKLNKQEQRIITTLVEKPLRRIEIANNLGVTSGAIGASLKTLQNKMLIELNNEKYQLYDQIFKA